MKKYIEEQIHIQYITFSTKYASTVVFLDAFLLIYWITIEFISLNFDWVIIDLNQSDIKIRYSFMIR